MRDIDRELGVGDDLFSPLVLPLDNKVEVTHEHVGGDSGPGLSADTSGGSIERNPNVGTCSPSCVGTASALLPVSFTHRIFRSYVCPSALYGLAFVPDGA